MDSQPSNKSNKSSDSYIILLFLLIFGGLTLAGIHGGLYNPQFNSNVQEITNNVTPAMPKKSVLNFINDFIPQQILDLLGIGGGRLIIASPDSVSLKYIGDSFTPKVIFVLDKSGKEIDITGDKNIAYTVTGNIFSVDSTGTIHALKQGSSVFTIDYLGYQTVIVATVTANSLSGNIYYVDGVNGHDGNNGRSIQNAWRTIGWANDVLKAGDTVRVLPAIYWEQISPSANGEAGRPITYEAFTRPGEIVQITGPRQIVDDSQIILYNKTYIAIVGFNFVNPMLGWGKIVNGGNNLIADNIFTGNGKRGGNIDDRIAPVPPPYIYDPAMPYGCFSVQGNSHSNYFIGNIFKECGTRGDDKEIDDESHWGDALVFSPGADGNYVQGDTFIDAGHTNLVFASSDNRVENSDFWNAWQKNLSINANFYAYSGSAGKVRNNYVANNRFHQSAINARFGGVFGGGCAIQVGAPSNFIEDNRIEGVERCGIIVNVWGDAPDASGNIIRGNLITKSPLAYEGGIYLTDQGGPQFNVSNNLFIENKVDTGGVKQMVIKIGGIGSGVNPLWDTIIRNNYLWNADGGDTISPVMEINGRLESLKFWQNFYPENIFDNLEQSLN